MGKKNSSKIKISQKEDPTSLKVSHSKKETIFKAINTFNLEKFKVVSTDKDNKEAKGRVSEALIKKIHEIRAARKDEIENVTHYLSGGLTDQELLRINNKYSDYSNLVLKMLQDIIEKKYPVDEQAWWALIPEIAEGQGFKLIDYIISTMHVEISQVLLKFIVTKTIESNQKEVFEKLLPKITLEIACTIGKHGNLLHIAAASSEVIYLSKILKQFSEAREHLDVPDPNGHLPKDYAFSSGNSLNYSILNRYGYRYSDRIKSPDILAFILLNASLQNKDLINKNKSQVDFNKCFDLFIKDNFSEEELLKTFIVKKTTYNVLDFIHLLPPEACMYLLRATFEKMAKNFNDENKGQFEEILKKTSEKIDFKTLPISHVEIDKEIPTSILETNPELFSQILREYKKNKTLPDWKNALLVNAISNSNSHGEDVFARTILLYNNQLFKQLIEFYQTCDEEYRQYLPSKLDVQNEYLQNYFHYLSSVDVYNNDGHIDTVVNTAVNDIFDVLYQSIPHAISVCDDENISPILSALRNDNLGLFRKFIESGEKLETCPVPKGYPTLHHYLVTEIESTTVLILLENRIIDLKSLIAIGKDFEPFLNRIVDDGSILLELAKCSEFSSHVTDLAHIFKEHRSDVIQKTDAFGKNFLHYLCGNYENIGAIQIFLATRKFDALLNSKDQEGKTPLDIIQENNDLTKALKEFLLRFKKISIPTTPRVFSAKPVESKIDDKNEEPKTKDEKGDVSSPASSPAFSFNRKSEIETVSNASSLFPKAPLTPKTAKTKKRRAQKKAENIQLETEITTERQEPTTYAEIKLSESGVTNHFSRKVTNNWHHLISSAKEDEHGMIRISCEAWGIDTESLISKDLRYLIDHLCNIYRSEEIDDRHIMLVGSKVPQYMLLNKFALANDEDFIVSGLTASDIQAYFETRPQLNVRANFISTFRTQGAVIQLQYKKEIQESLESQPTKKVEYLSYDFKPVEKLHEQFYERDFTLNGIALDLFTMELVGPKEWFKNLLKTQIVSIPKPDKFKFTIVEKVRCAKMLLKYAPLNPTMDEKTDTALKIPEFNQDHAKLPEILQLIGNQHEPNIILQKIIEEANTYRYHRADLGNTELALDIFSFQFSKILDHSDYQNGLALIDNCDLLKQVKIDPPELAEQYQIVQKFLTDYRHSLKLAYDVDRSEVTLQKLRLVENELKRVDHELLRVRTNIHSVSRFLRQLIQVKGKCPPSFIEYTQGIAKLVVCTNYDMNKIPCQEFAEKVKTLLDQLPELKRLQPEKDYKLIKRFAYGMLAATLMHGYDVQLYLTPSINITPEAASSRLNNTL